MCAAIHEVQLKEFLMQQRYLACLDKHLEIGYLGDLAMVQSLVLSLT